jgi:hypothetical protein
MLPNEIELAIGGSTHHYSLASLADNRSVRQEIGGNLSLPQSLTISRNTSGKGTKAIDNYLIRLDQVVATEVDASSNVQASQTLSVYMVLKIPRSVNNNLGAAYNLGVALRSFINVTAEGSSETYLSRILKGEL